MFPTKEFKYFDFFCVIEGLFKVLLSKLSVNRSVNLLFFYLFFLSLC